MKDVSNQLPRIALITSGISPAAQYFSMLPGTPVGVINWKNEPCDDDGQMRHNGLSRRIKNRLIATIRNRQYASLQHLCIAEDLQYADIYKRDLERLTAVLTQWQCDLVVTSRCSFVPTKALPELRCGAINLHPSWLPDYRGAEPMLWHVAENQDYVAASVHVLTDSYDQGAVLAQKRMPRPAAASKAELSHATETVLGRDLLSTVIELLVDKPDYKGTKQPENSDTRYARRETPESFAKDHALDTLNHDVVWDLLHYFGNCPNEWLGLGGWRSKLKWYPASTRDCDKNRDDKVWTTSVGVKTISLNKNGHTIVLKPRYRSVLSLLRS